jgi:predicted GNAT family N-acyltransferase
MHGDDNADAVHLAAFDDGGTVVGCCLILPRDFPLRPDDAGAWQLRGMATAAGQQGQGIGAGVLARAFDEARRRGGRLVWCEARVTAVAFYRQHGLQPVGGEFQHAESGIPHQRMWRELSGPSDR